MSEKATTESRSLALRGVPVDRPMTGREAITRWPRVVAHMICESLGYFTPKSASEALASYKNNDSYACEWYSHICSQRNKGFFDEAELKLIGADVVKWAFLNRERHKGYMAEFQNAMVLVLEELKTKDGLPCSMLASWF